MTRRPRRGPREEFFEVVERAVDRVDVVVVGDVVAVVPQRRRIEGQQPDRGDAEVLQVVELAGQPVEIADAVAVAVGEGADVDLVNDRVLVPRRDRPDGLARRRAGGRACCGSGGGVRRIRRVSIVRYRCRH